MNHSYSSTDTIVALATAQGTSAIGVIRLSGDESIGIVNNLFSKDIRDTAPNIVHYGTISYKDQIIDECLVTIFRNPRSYTKEDSVEISCHGSPYILEQVIKACVMEGARLAKRGEFTQRAFLNGQLDLSQAEAVADLISADSHFSHTLALKQLRGGFSKDLKAIRHKLIDFASLIELELDFGEEDVEFASRTDLSQTTNELIQALQELKESFDIGNALKKGIKTVIVGKPNAGKSTLLNALLNSERAIVSAQAGTTRDTIEDELMIDGIKFLLTDTAGLRKTDDDIEKAGVERSLEKISTAQIILYVVDITDVQPQEVWAELKSFDKSNGEVILILNKMDLYPTLNPDIFITKGLVTKESIIPTSAINKMNISRITDHLTSIVKTTNTHDRTLVTNARHFESLQKTIQSLTKVKEGLAMNISGDFLALDLRHALHYLGLITGEIHTDDLLDNIFSSFCIGK